MNSTSPDRRLYLDNAIYEALEADPCRPQDMSVRQYARKLLYRLYIDDKQGRAFPELKEVDVLIEDKKV